MLFILIKLCIVAVAMLIVSYLMSGVRVRSFGAAFIAAVILGLVNAFIRPLLMFLSAPINWLTLGLFVFVVNGVLFKLVAEFVDGLTVKNWTSAIIGSILISIVSTVMNWVLL
ncbi:MAG: phage holin family protein [bacterium]|nr:phage holin family protein [bacterium]